MRNTVLSLMLSTSVGLGLQQAALAADMPVKAAKAPIAAAVYDWSGFYVGTHIGGAWSNSTVTNGNIGTSWNTGGTGFIGGFPGGLQFPNWKFPFRRRGRFRLDNIRRHKWRNCHATRHSPSFRKETGSDGRCPLRHYLGPPIGLQQDWCRLGPIQYSAERC